MPEASQTTSMPDASPPRPSGKHAFDDIYNAADPRAYWGRLAPLDYRIPGHAQDVYSLLVEARRRDANGRQINVTDLCCSYGTTAALLKHTSTIDDLMERYSSREHDGLSAEELCARDIDFYAARRRPHPPHVVGLDVAPNAVSYALRAGLLDDGYAENLEVDEPSRALRQSLVATDLVTVTGGVGYIRERTFDRVLSHLPGDRFPWVAAFVLRWVDYDPITEVLARHGLVTERLSVRTFPQRRFADDAERQYVLSTLSAQGIDARGKETDGHHHAYLYVSRPAEAVSADPLDAWLNKLNALAGRRGRAG